MSDSSSDLWLHFLCVTFRLDFDCGPRSKCNRFSSPLSTAEEHSASLGCAAHLQCHHVRSWKEINLEHLGYNTIGAQLRTPHRAVGAVLARSDTCALGNLEHRYGLGEGRIICEAQRSCYSGRSASLLSDRRNRMKPSTIIFGHAAAHPDPRISGHKRQA